MDKLHPAVQKYLSERGKRIGAKGGKARAAKLSKAQRSEAARKAVQARWAKARKKAEEKS